MGCNDMVPIGELIEFSRGGGWGSESPFDGSVRVAVIRGADFPSVQQGNYTGLPIRFEKKAKVRSVELHAGDIVLENSGGTATRPTGRTVLITQTLIDSYDCPVIPASFCRLLRFSPSIDSTFAYYWLQEMYHAGRTWGYQNRSTGLSNFQFKVFSAKECMPGISAEEQRHIACILAEIDKKIVLNNRTNGYLAALIAARFAEDFGDDCHTARLGDVLRISTKTVKPQDHAGEIWEHYSIPAFDESHRPVMEPANEIKSNKYIVSRNSILISKLNPSIKRFWLPACLTDHPVCSTEFIVFEPTRPENKSFYAAAISSNNFQNYLMVHVTGSTGSRQRAQPKSTLDFPMPNPSESA